MTDHRDDGAAVEAAFVVAVAVVVGATRTGAWDTWWHLLIGRVAWEGKTSLPFDIFSFSAAGEPWVYKDLIADILFYWGYSALGYAWFAMVKASAVIGLAVGLRLAGGNGSNRASRMLLVALVTAAIHYRLVERPLVFSLALFPVLAGLLERTATRLSTETRPATAVRLILPPLLVQWAWVQIHREAMVGYILLAAFVLRFVLAMPGASRGGWRRFFGAATSVGTAAAVCLLLAAFVLGFVNPSGVGFFETSLEVAGSDMLRERISEWARLPPATLATEFPMVAILAGVASVVAIVGLARAARRLDQEPAITVASAMVLAFFVAASLDSVRWIPYLALWSAVAVVRPVAALERAAFLTPRSARGLAWGRPLVAIASVGVVILFGPFPLGLGPMEGRYPEGAMEYARANGLGGRVACPLHLGGYILWKLWPGTRVLLDGRNDMVYAPDIVDRTIRAEHDPAVFQALAREYEITWVVAGNEPGRITHAFLADDPAWALVYWSEPAAIYVSLRSHPALESDRYTAIDPRRPDASVFAATVTALGDPRALDRIGREVKRMVAASPRGLRANAVLAVHLHALGAAWRGERDRVVSFVRGLPNGQRLASDLEARFLASASGGSR